MYEISYVSSLTRKYKKIEKENTKILRMGHKT
jgi:hypothetical protein